MCLERVSGQLRTWARRVGIEALARRRTARCCGALWLVAVGVLVPGAVYADPAGERPMLTRVRAAAHADYDRLVFDLEGPAELIRVGHLPAGDFGIDLGVRLPERGLAYAAALVRVRGLVTEPVPGGNRVRLTAANARVRVFRLGRPERLIVDFADPGPSAFPVPEGAEAIPVLPVAAAVVRATPALSPGLPEPAAPPGPRPVVPAASGSLATATDLRAVPTVPLAPRAWEKPRREAPRPPALPATPYRGLVLAIWIVLGLGLCAAAGFGVRAGVRSRATSQRSPARRSEMPRAPESITPAEVRAAGDRIDVLERRIDQELQARQRVELRLGEMQERLKVLDDRVRRFRRVSPRPRSVADVRPLMGPATPSPGQGAE